MIKGYATIDATGEWASQNEPLSYVLLNHTGLMVSLCTDNRLMSATTVTEEYWRAHQHLGFTWDELTRIARMGFESAFLHRAEKDALLAEVDAEIAAL